MSIATDECPWVVTLHTSHLGGPVRLASQSNRTAWTFDPENARRFHCEPDARRWMGENLSAFSECGYSAHVLRLDRPFAAEGTVAR